MLSQLSYIPTGQGFRGRGHRKRGGQSPPNCAAFYQRDREGQAARSAMRARWRSFFGPRYFFSEAPMNSATSRFNFASSAEWMYIMWPAT